MYASCRFKHIHPSQLAWKQQMHVILNWRSCSSTLVTNKTELSWTPWWFTLRENVYDIQYCNGVRQLSIRTHPSITVGLKVTDECDIELMELSKYTSDYIWTHVADIVAELPWAQWWFALNSWWKVLEIVDLSVPQHYINSCQQKRLRLRWANGLSTKPTTST